MHYKNGRIARNGDRVVVVPSYGPPYIGILYDAVAGNDYCNGRVAVVSPSDPSVNLQEALHFDDARTALGDISQVTDTSQPQPVPAAV